MNLVVCKIPDISSRYSLEKIGAKIGFNEMTQKLLAKKLKTAKNGVFFGIEVNGWINVESFFVGGEFSFDI